MLEALIARVKSEPVLVAGVVAAVLVVAAGQLDIVLDEATVKDAIVPLVTAVLVRSRVSPAVKP